MKTITKQLAALPLALGLAAGSAQAASVSSTLFAGFQQLSDNSAEYLIDNAGGATTVDVGDQLHGIFTIHTTEQSPNTRNLGGGSSNNELSGVFEIEIVSKVDTGTPGPGRYLWTFGPSGNLDAYAPGAMVVFFEDSAHEYSRVDTDPTPGLQDTTAILEALITDGSVFWVAGVGSTGFWNASASTDDITLIGSIPAPGIGGGYNTGLELLVNNSGREIKQVPCFDPFTATIVSVDMCGSGSLLGTGGVVTPYESFDNVDFTVNVPEPASVALMGLGLLGLAGAARRKAS